MAASIASAASGAPFGDAHQPGSRIVRNAGPRPLGQGDDQCVLRQFFGNIDIPYEAGQARDEPGPFDAKGHLYWSMDFRLVHVPCGHTAFSANAAGETSGVQATPSLPRSPARGAESSSGVMNSATRSG